MSEGDVGYQIGRWARDERYREETRQGERLRDRRHHEAQREEDHRHQLEEKERDWKESRDENERNRKFQHEQHEKDRRDRSSDRLAAEVHEDQMRRQHQADREREREEEREQDRQDSLLLGRCREACRDEGAGRDPSAIAAAGGSASGKAGDLRRCEDCNKNYFLSAVKDDFSPSNWFKCVACNIKRLRKARLAEQAEERADQGRIETDIRNRIVAEAEEFLEELSRKLAVIWETERKRLAEDHKRALILAEIRRKHAQERLQSGSDSTTTLPPACPPPPYCEHPDDSTVQEPEPPSTDLVKTGSSKCTSTSSNPSLLSRLELAEAEAELTRLQRLDEKQAHTMLMEDLAKERASLAIERRVQEQQHKARLAEAIMRLEHESERKIEENRRECAGRASDSETRRVRAETALASERAFFKRITLVIVAAVVLGTLTTKSQK